MGPALKGFASLLVYREQDTVNWKQHKLQQLGDQVDLVGNMRSSATAMIKLKKLHAHFGAVFSSVITALAGKTSEELYPAPDSAQKQDQDQYNWSVAGVLKCVELACDSYALGLHLNESMDTILQG